MEPREISIGDIHGCFDDFVDLLKAIGPIGLEDKIIFLGDLIDRGPQSREVVEKIREMKESMPDRVFIVRGNHEDMLFDYLGLESVCEYGEGFFEKHGGLATVGSFRTKESLLAAGQWLHKNTVIHLETKQALYAHAGFMPRAKSSAETNLWIPDLAVYCETVNYSFPKRLIVGHTPVGMAPLLIPKNNLIMMDSGSVFGIAPLSAYDVVNFTAYYANGETKNLAAYAG